MLRRLLFLPLLLLAPLSSSSLPQTGPPPEEEKKALEPQHNPDSYGGLRLRSIGPGFLSGRINSMAVHPDNNAIYYVGVASGGVWKTTNAGTTWQPIFDREGSYSIGYVTLDPKNPDTVWVGTGEYNSQRSVGYGDGVYKSLDGGKSWNKVGLTESEHIGKILIDPRDSNTVYVAAQGPLWGPGGDRGLYKTTDGGKSWQRILNISKDTGVTDVVQDPRNPDVLVAASYQRRRHVWTLINGGPEAGIHRSIDGGKTWTKITSGLPGGDLGRIGLAVAPSSPNVVYAQVEAADGKGGLHRSDDFGLTWKKQNSFDRGAMYFGQVVVHPANPDKVFSLNVYLMVSDDGGKTQKKFGQKYVHVDHHCLWINPKQPDHYRIGCDGGVYESHDGGATWRHFANLPVTQFYDITVSQDGPFYTVYGGTQDNNTAGGPARTRSAHGITNADWFVLHVGDGFHCKVDPQDPDTIYAEAQYGDLVRYSRKTGETVGIRPYPAKGEPPLRWNWSSPLVLSPHARTRLYYASNRIFRSDDRGDSWKPVSGDLTRKIDRDKLRVMGKLWGPDAVAKHQSTSLYGSIIALAESPKQEDMLVAGTDDGLIHVTTDAGGKWRTIDKFPGVPEKTYVCRVLASQHAADTIYAAFNNHKNADFAPYLLRSADAGKTWTSIRGNLPSNGPIRAIAEDPVDPDLLFVGTEFGLFFTLDGGKNWVAWKSGLPTIMVADLAIQKTENDLIVGTFGRGFYVLDDYSALRKLKKETLTAEAHLFGVRDALLYIETRQYGLKGKAFRGESLWTAENPPFGAVFTYHLGDTIRTKKQQRLEAEKKLGQMATYPSQDALRAEAEEEAPAVLFEVSDKSGSVLRRIEGPVTKGFHRVAWDLREPGPTLPKSDDDLFTTPDVGPFVPPGIYTVKMSIRQAGKIREVKGSQTFQVKAWGRTGKEVDGLTELVAFQRKLAALRRAATAAAETASDAQKKLAEMRKAADAAPKVSAAERTRIRTLEQRVRDIQRALRGDGVLRARNENTPISVLDRVGAMVDEQYYSLSAPTKTHQRLYDEASEELTTEVGKLRGIVEKEIKAVERTLDEAGAPWTTGRLPVWKEK